MVLIHALEAVCDLLPYFAAASLFRACREAGLIIASVLLLVFFASLILEKYKAFAVRILCGLLPALGLFTAKTPAQMLLTVPALLIWCILAVSGRHEIYYEDYKYWFGIPAVMVLVILIVSLSADLSEQQFSHLSVLCGSAYLALGIIILRRKRMGAGASSVAKLLNIAEIGVAALSGILACALLWTVLKVSWKALEILILPLGAVLSGLISLFVFISSAFGGELPAEEITPSETAAEISTEIMENDPAVPSAKPGSYAFAETLGQITLYILILALLFIIAYLVYRIIKNIRTGGYAGDPEYEDKHNERSVSGKSRKKKRKRIYTTNNDKIRQIYREYLFYIRQNGISIGRQATSEEVLAASKQLADCDEAISLRALYIRARYNDERQLNDEEVLKAQTLWNTIREYYEAEKQHRKK